jgi:hypothetical protein
MDTRIVRRHPKKCRACHIPQGCAVPLAKIGEAGNMKRILAFVLGTVIAVSLFVVLVHFVLVAAHLSEPAATTVRGLTSRRLWASIAAVLALAAVAGGGLALARPAKLAGAASARHGAVVALVAGPIAAINGALNLAFANGGPGTGNGVIGAAAAFVLGLIATALGGLALARRRTRIVEPEQMT